jgi:hypothetical protein
MSDVPDEKKWLTGFADEMDRIEKLVPCNFLPSDAEYPAWVPNVEREMSLVLLPAAKLGKNWGEASSKRMGAVLGHQCAIVVWMREWLYQEDTGTPEEPLTEEQIREGEEIVNKFNEWYEAMRGMAKQALASSVDQTYEDMRDFLLGFSDGFSRKPKNFGAGDMGNTTFKVYLFMLLFWRQIQQMKSVPELHRSLVVMLGAQQVGELKRIEKICQRIGLSFRKPGRPSKS